MLKIICDGNMRDVIFNDEKKNMITYLINYCDGSKMDDELRKDIIDNYKPWIIILSDRFHHDDLSEEQIQILRERRLKATKESHKKVDSTEYRKNYYNTHKEQYEKYKIKWLEKYHKNREIKLEEELEQLYDKMRETSYIRYHMNEEKMKQQARDRYKKKKEKNGIVSGQEL